MSNDRLLLWITRVFIFMPWLDYVIKIMLGSIPHQKLSFFIIYLLEDGQELSLGMLIRLCCIFNFWLFHANIIQLSYPCWQLFILFLGLTYWSSTSSCLLHVFCFAEYPYQTESKWDKNWQRFFWNILGRKIHARRCSRGPRGRGHALGGGAPCLVTTSGTSSRWFSFRIFHIFQK